MTLTLCCVVLAAPSVHQTEQTTSGESPTPPTPDAPSGSKSGSVDTMEVVKRVFHYISVAVAGLFFIEVRSYSATALLFV